MASQYLRRPPPVVRDDQSTSILVFPSRAPSAPPSPHRAPLPAPSLSGRHGSTTSIPTSLIASVEGQSTSPRSLSPSGSSWDGTSDEPGQRLTHDRVARIGTVRAGPNWRTATADLLPTDDDDVEVWEWTASSASPTSEAVSLLQGRRPLSPRTVASTHYESASSQIHFSASSEFESTDDEPDFESMFLVTLKSRRHAQPLQRRDPTSVVPNGGNDPAGSSFFSPKILPLPFESLLRFFFDLDLSTLDLIKQQNARPHPDNPFNSPPTNLFASRVAPPSPTADDDDEIHNNSSNIAGALIIRRKSDGQSLFVDDVHSAANSLRRGFEADRDATSIPSSTGTGSIIIGMARLPILLARAVLRI